MADSSDSVGGVGGSSGVGGSNAAADAAAAQASAAERAATAMVDAVTGPTGVNVDALGTAVANVAASSPAVAAELQAAVEAQLSPVQVGQLQAAIDAATLSGAVPSAIDVATAPSLPPTDFAPSMYNAKGQVIDTCGNVVTSVSVPRADPLAESYRQAVENLGRAVGGPISGPVYTAAWANGVPQDTLDDVYSVVQHADGLFERFAGAAETMHVPIVDRRP